MRALIFGLLHQKPAQRFRPLVDRKEMMPLRIGDNLEKSDLFGHGLEETWREAKVDDNARGILPVAEDRQARR